MTAESFFIRTYTGRKLFFDPSIENDISIHDVAAHLSRIPRFLGATKSPYSVAQHAVITAQIAMERSANDVMVGLYALHHDDHEMGMGDWPTPLKHFIEAITGRDIAGYIADKLDEDVARAFNLQFPTPPAIARVVKEADMIAYATEAKQMMRNFQLEPGLSTANLNIEPLSAERAEALFLTQHNALTKRRGRRAA